MKALARRFAVIAVLGSVLCGALVAGCSSPPEDEAPANAANAAAAPE